MPELLLAIICGTCNRAVHARVVAGSNSSGNTCWVQCPACNEGSVRLKTGAVHPVAPAGGFVKRLPDDVDRAWREARASHAVAAYTASELMCRKILMHIAVDVAGSAEGRSFAEYINELESTGYITTGLRSTIDRIRQRGNIANHELPASSEQDSLGTLNITEYLLRGAYELSESEDSEQ